jgi:hypothetical protein
MKRKTHRRTAATRARTATQQVSRSKPRKTLRSHVKTASSRKAASREKVRAYRKRMRGKGFRLIQMWLPDTRSPEFKAQAHRDSLAIANSATEAEEQAFIDSVQWWTSKEAEDLANLEPERWWREPTD